MPARRSTAARLATVAAVGVAPLALSAAAPRPRTAPWATR